MKKQGKFCLVLRAACISTTLSCLIPVQVYAASPNLTPRVIANAYSSDYVVGQADIMFPLSSNASETDNFYLNPQLAYATDNQGYADLGLGYRRIQNNAAILGAYLFGGYTRIDNNARLWVINPGVEALGSRWDARINGYIPLGDQHYYVSTFGILGFTGHSQISDLMQQTQYVGNGADIRLGYQLFPGNSLKGYVGSYFFIPAQTSNIWGGAAGLEYWLESYMKVFASYTYDNLRHSTGAIGLGVEFGGTHLQRSDPTLKERLTDPVDRYLSELGRGSAIPSPLLTTPLGIRLTTLNNIAFFSQTGTPNNGGGAITLENCTFENPCGPTDFSQPAINTLNTLLPNTIMYFNGGVYPSAAGATITLNAGQSIHSRTSDYSQLATGAGRSTFVGAFVLNSNNTLENIILLPTPSTASGNGISASNATDILITGSQIGNNGNNHNIGIVFANNSLGVISGVEIFSGEAAILVASNSNALIADSILNATNGNGSTGLWTQGGGFGDMENCIVNVMSGIGNIAGILTQASNAVANDVKITVVNTGAGGNRIVNNTGASTVDLSNGILKVSGPNAQIINPGGAAGINITNSICMINGVTGACP